MRNTNQAMIMLISRSLTCSSARGLFILAFPTWGQNPQGTLELNTAALNLEFPAPNPFLEAATYKCFC